MAEKFLESDSIYEVKEVLGLTRLGQMLYNDGVENGKEQAKLDIARKFLGTLPDEEISEKTGVALDVIKKMHSEL